MEYILDNLLMGKDQVLELLNGIMDNSLKVYGKMELNKGRELGNLQKEIFISEIGKIIGNKVKEFISTMDQLTKDSFFNF